MKRTVTAWVLAAVLGSAAAWPAGAADAARASDPEAVELAERIIESLGGMDRWNALPGIRWSFGGERGDTLRYVRRHAWNKHSGWHRVEGSNFRGSAFCFIHNLNTGEGRAWMNGQAIEGDSLAKLLDVAKAMWVNDSYWLLMPYKLRDPGVVLALEDPVTEDGVTYDRLTLAFENVGRTPGDRYWLFVERGTHRIRKWEMVLEGDSPPARSNRWDGWQEHGGLWFATEHPRDESNTFTRDIETVTTFGAEEFASP